MTRMEELRPCKTLNGKFDGYCHVCWNPVYVLWVDSESPDHSKCPFGAASAHTCEDAIGRAKLSATLFHLEERGLLVRKADR